MAESGRKFQEVTVAAAHTRTSTENRRDLFSCRTRCTSFGTFPRDRVLANEARHPGTEWTSTGDSAVAFGRLVETRNLHSKSYPQPKSLTLSVGVAR